VEQVARERLLYDETLGLPEGIVGALLAVYSYPVTDSVRLTVSDVVLAVALIEPVTHGWDLALATAQRVTFEEDTVAALLAGVQQLGDQLAATGMDAPARCVADQVPPFE